jgi:nickel-dependent lactate racemase
MLRACGDRQKSSSSDLLSTLRLEMAEPARPGPSVQPSANLQLKTAAWYGDETLNLDLPESWDVSVFAPSTGRSLTDAEIWERFETPVGQRPIRERCSAATRPLIIVDDLNRPTPASRVLPFLVRQFTEAGVPTRNITIIVGPGTHAPPNADAVAKKVGADLINSCRVCVHDRTQPVVKLGRTSFGTPVRLSREVVKSNFLVSVGGLYPNHTGGFGGGSKAALGILDFRSIAALHFGHESHGWGSLAGSNTFRRDLDEIARLIGLETGVCVVVDANRQVVDLTCGDIHQLYPRFLARTKESFRAPRPDPGVRIVVSNAYPNDLSLTFVRMKGTVPLALAPDGASRVVVASCSEGLGFHGLFPFMNAPRFHRQRMLQRRIAANLNKPRRFARKAGSRLTGMRRRATTAPRFPTWLYCPSPREIALLPPEIPGIRVTSSWSEVVDGVSAEQNHDSPLRTFVYAAAPLQWLD